MPRLIDHAERDREIIAAAFTVLERDGLAGLSVRGVAAEAGIATASLRRAFPTQNSLRAHCLDQIRDRASARIRAVPGEGRERHLGMLAELLPLDAERRLELSAQLQLAVLALTDPALRAASLALGDGVRTVCRLVVEPLAATGGLRDGETVESAAADLHCFLDGLALHALTDPLRHEPSVLRRRLREFVDRIGPAAACGGDG